MVDPAASPPPAPDPSAPGAAARDLPDDVPGELLFSYGTLQLPAVQLDTFGRLLESEDDVLPGYTIDYADIADPRVVGVSGLATHPIVRATGSPRDKVSGCVLVLSRDELDAADEYEVALYRRVSAVLVSGRTAWVYVSA